MRDGCFFIGPPDARAGRVLLACSERYVGSRERCSVRIGYDLADAGEFVLSRCCVRYNYGPGGEIARAVL